AVARRGAPGARQRGPAALPSHPRLARVRRALHHRERPAHGEPEAAPRRGRGALRRGHRRAVRAVRRGGAPLRGRRPRGRRLSWQGRALSWERRGPALEVTLHREPCNEIGTTTLAELERLADVVRGGAMGARAVILHSGMRGFCAGADLRELHAGLRERRESSRVVRLLGGRRRRLVARLARREIRSFLDRIHAVFDTLDTAPVPTIAAVHGVCFGGGFELALTADVIVADRSARF